MSISLSSTPASMLTTSIVAAFPSASACEALVSENDYATATGFIPTRSYALQLVVLRRFPLIKLDLAAGTAFRHGLSLELLLDNLIMNNFQETTFPASRLTCERCSGHGYIKTGLGRLPCHDCSAAASSWIPASQPPASDSKNASHSIMCLGAVVFDGGLMHDLVAYWPARNRWTATRLDGMEPADIEVEVSHYQELPALPPETRKDFPSYAFGELQQEPTEVRPTE